MSFCMTDEKLEELIHRYLDKRYIDLSTEQPKYGSEDYNVWITVKNTGNKIGEYDQTFSILFVYVNILEDISGTFYLKLYDAPKKYIKSWIEKKLNLHFNKVM